MSDERSTARPTLPRLLLAGGYLAVFVAVVAAYTSPAIGYEVGIYEATPTLTWLGLAVAFVVSLAVALRVESARIRGFALLLGGQATAVVVGLPVLRNYYYHGTADAMTHLGWVKDLSSAAETPFDIFYPGIHTASVFVARLSGLPPERSVLLVVFVIFLALIAFVPLAVRAISDSGTAVTIGAFTAFLILPINIVSTHPHAHPFTQTALFSALVIYLMVRYVRQSSEPFSVFDPTSIGALLALVGAATVLYHPQQAANVVILFVAVSLVQLAYRWRKPQHPISNHRPLFGQTAFLVVVFAAWNVRYELFFDGVDALVATFAGYLSGNPPQAAASVESQGASLAAIGSGLPEIFLKLFLVSTVFSVLAGALIVGSLTGRLDRSLAEQNALVKYLSVATVAIFPLFVVYLLGSVSEQYFRHFGFLMVIVSILGALALSRWLDRSEHEEGVGWRTSVTGAAIAVMLVLSLVTVFPSPYMHRATQHVTEEQLSTYEASFEYHDQEVALLGVRQGPWRFSQGVNGVDDSREYRERVPDGGLVELGDLFDSPRYLVITEYDYQREIVAYEELRYSARGFETLGRQPEVNRVMSTGEGALYYVNPESTSATTEALVRPVPPSSASFRLEIGSGNGAPANGVL